MAAIIRNPNRYGALVEEDLRVFEKKFGYQLPNDYREFLLTVNGGKPVPDQFNTGQGDRTILQVFWGIHQDNFDESLVRQLEILDDQIPLGILPIGNDDFGNLVCLLLNGDQRGTILFWDHETGETIPIAASFTAFLDSLVAG